MSVAQLIKTKRTRLGLTQKHFAELAGLGEVGERTVRGWENDEHAPTPNALVRIMGIPENARYRSQNKNPMFRFIYLFAGIGGVRLPFQDAGGECVFTSEWDKFSKRPTQRISEKCRRGTLQR